MGCAVSKELYRYDCCEDPQLPYSCDCYEDPQLPFDSRMTNLTPNFKVSACFLFDKMDFDGHHGLFSKGDVAGCKSGWLINTNSGVISVHIFGGKGWMAASELSIFATEWNTISVEQLQDGGFVIAANGTFQRFSGCLTSNSTYPLKVGIQDSSNRFLGQIKNIVIEKGAPLEWGYGEAGDNTPRGNSEAMFTDIRHMEVPPLPFDSRITNLTPYFKVSACFLFDKMDFDGHHGLFSKGDVAGCKSGWLINTNSGVISVHIFGGKGWMAASELSIFATEWNTISVEQLQDGGFVIAANGTFQRFSGYLAPTSTYPLKVGIQDSSNRFLGQIKNIVISQTLL